VSGLGAGVVIKGLMGNCPCWSQVTGTIFIIRNSDRVASKMGAAATISFTTTDAGKLLIGSKITLNYPVGFFAASSTPAVAISSGATGSAAVPNATSIVITTGNVALNASTDVTITLMGLTMGAVTGGSSSGITMLTSVDPTPSTPIPSGPILFSFTPPPPVTAGLIAHYSADSWMGSQWLDLSGTGNHVTEIGGSSIAVARPVGAPAYIYGAGTAWMRFPAGILPSANYTLFYVARYNGITRSRIFQGCYKIQWYSGFKDFSGVGFTGVVSHGACVYNVTDGSTNWLLGSDRSDSYRSNGKATPYSGCATSYDRICVNNVFTGCSACEKSDFAIQSILVYNVKLSDADVQRVEAWLQAQQPEFTPANLQVCKRR